MERTSAVTAAAGRPTTAGVYASHHGRIRRYLAHLVRDPEEAEDLTQETFLRAHRQLASLRDPAALTTWLYRIPPPAPSDPCRHTPRAGPPLFFKEGRPRLQQAARPFQGGLVAQRPGGLLLHLPLKEEGIGGGG